ncbi:MAG: nucleoside-diphosphate sugar epimerase/dehydratase [Maribacter arcticus]|uniref:polysaccharide biosynthesis protein n=1 Tax=Maribacter arcticus TaxID=561365 RepID=UPI0030036DF4
MNFIIRNSKNHSSKWLVFLIDIFVIGFCFFLSYLVRFNLTLSFETEKLILQLPIILLFSGISILINNSHKGVVRHTGARDVYNIFNAVCLGSILTILFVLINKKSNLINGFTIPLSIIIIHSLLSFLALTTSRFIFKYLYQKLITTDLKTIKNILIYGTGDEAIITHNVIFNKPLNNTRVVGYVNYENQKIRKQINGLTIYDKSILTKEFILSKNISEIIFSVQNISPNNLRILIEGLVDLPVQVKIVPPVDAWINGELKPSQIKQIQIDDLLNRPPIILKKDKIENELSDKIILVTGGAGSIGSELIRQIALYEYRSLIIVDQAESPLYDLQQELKQNGHHNFIPLVGDIRDKNRMSQIFEEYKPNIVFHAAAYKHVPLMETNPYEAIKINIAGTKTIADLSSQNNVEKFVFVSTDKAVNPTNVMGASKRIAEMYICCLQQTSKTKFITTRFGNVLGSNGSVIPLFKKQIEKGGPLTVTHKEITRYFMTIPEASLLVLEAAAMGKGGELFIFNMGDSVKIFDLAKNMIKLSGLSYPEDIDIKITGLRPGEKLYEELLANGENTIPTYNKKIMISKVRDIDYGIVKSKIDELCITNIFSMGNTVKIMKEIVPEFISNNSEYEKLDKSTRNNILFELKTKTKSSNYLKSVQ